MLKSDPENSEPCVALSTEEPERLEQAGRTMICKTFAALLTSDEGKGGAVKLL